jgi:hypothetical protein
MSAERTASLLAYEHSLTVACTCRLANMSFFTIDQDGVFRQDLGRARGVGPPACASL